ncbi:MAG: hypothetical protein ACYTXA_25610 [Nostoc sp.]
MLSKITIQNSTLRSPLHSLHFAHDVAVLAGICPSSDDDWV